MRPQLSRRRTLPAVMAVLAATGVLTAAPALTDAVRPAVAADEFTCQQTARLWAVRATTKLHLHEHHAPATGADAWSNGSEVSSGWPAASWAGPDGRMYYLNAADGTLQRHRWLGTGSPSWENGGTSKPIREGMGYYADPAGARKLTIDSTGAFYMVDGNGGLWRRTYDEATGVWDELAIDSGWDRYDLIFAAGDGVLWARQPNGAMFRYRFHAGSQRWLTPAPVAIPGIPWEQYQNLTSPGADVIYGIRDNKVYWFRYSETAHHITSGVQAGTWWTDGVTALAAPDACTLVTEPGPARPSVPPTGYAKPALLKTSDGHLQFAYVNGNSDVVHSDIADVRVGPHPFSALPDTAVDFRGTPALAENTDGSTRIWARATDADARVFDRQAINSWKAPVNHFGRMLTAPQAVRTSDGKVGYVALSADGHVWAKQYGSNGTLYPWRRLTAQPISATGHVTAVTTGTSIHVVALRTGGDYCKLTVTPTAVGDWSCGGSGGTDAAAVVPLADNTLQLYARRADGRVYTTRTTASDTLTGAWTAVPVDLPGGALVVGDPAALRAPDGTVQLSVRGSDGWIYRTGQQAPASTAWWPWTEITNYSDEAGSDPAMSLANDTWLIAFRTPDGVPKMQFWVPSTTAARTGGAPVADQGSFTSAGD
ncbi:tachylectin-related carbohydrate-binding protein [Lentzea chajnantorensis]